MSIEAALFAYLSGLPAIQGLLGNPDGSVRIYRDTLPEEVAYPAMTFFRVSTPRVHALDGPTGLASPRFQFSAWSGDVANPDGSTRSGADDVLDIIDAVRVALDGYSGAMNGVAVRAILADEEGDRDMYDEKTRSYHRMIDFMVSHIET